MHDTAKAFFNWSGGKDSALALFRAQQAGGYRIERLLTNLSSQHRRISMHGVREVLLDAQAAAIGLPLQKLLLPESPSMNDYEAVMNQTLQGLKEDGFHHSFFGDIFLEDLRRYREEQLRPIGLQAHFPLWGEDTLALMRRFIDLGFKAVVVCANANLLDESFAGRVIDQQFLADLPPGVDPCGENGEFHTFVFDGPLFRYPVAYTNGEKVLRTYPAPKDPADNCFAKPSAKPATNGFWFCDLLLVA